MASTKEIVGEIDFAQPAPEALPAIVASGQMAAPVSMLDIIDRASRDPSVDIDKLERLIGMKERMEARQAQAAYDNAMAEAQKEMAPIRADMENKQTKSRYASYAQLDNAIRPIYAAHGFALSFDTGDAPNATEVRVLCTVSCQGHRENKKIDMPADGKGPQGAAVMTRTHATGAAASYGQRYLLKLIFNLAVGDIDDDGNSASGDGDLEGMVAADAARDENGKLLSTYNVNKANQARDRADELIQGINLGNAQSAREYMRENQKVQPGKKKSLVVWLRDNSPGQYLRVRQAYQNVTGEDLNEDME